MYSFVKLGIDDKQAIKELFLSVFTIEPWNDDWSDENQLDAYIHDLVGQSNSLTYGLSDGEKLIALSMGRIKHWYSGTEYCIDELCVRTENQGKGIGTYFLGEIEKAMKEIGLVQIYLQTEKGVPAYEFYLKTGFYQLEDQVSFGKQI